MNVFPLNLYQLIPTAAAVPNTVAIAAEVTATMKLFNTPFHREATEKGVIPVIDAGIHLRKSLCRKEIDYRDKPDNDNFRSFSATSSSAGGLFKEAVYEDYE